MAARLAEQSTKTSSLEIVVGITEYCRLYIQLYRRMIGKRLAGDEKTCQSIS
jgi:hypothetical protein